MSEQKTEQYEVKRRIQYDRSDDGTAVYHQPGDVVEMSPNNEATKKLLAGGAIGPLQLRLPSESEALKTAKARVMDLEAALADAEQRYAALLSDLEAAVDGATGKAADAVRQVLAGTGE